MLTPACPQIIDKRTYRPTIEGEMPHAKFTTCLTATVLRNSQGRRFEEVIEDADELAHYGGEGHLAGFAVYLRRL